MTLKLSLSLLVIVGFSYSYAYAVEGEVTFVAGDADLTLQQKPVQKATVGQHLRGGDSIQTHSKSSAIVTLDDHSQLKLNENSAITLDKETDGTSVQLTSGSLFSKVQKQKSLHKFSVKTHSAVMGVRGTEFFTAFGKQKSTDAQDVWMCVNEGQVEVESLETKKKVMVKQGEGVFINQGKNITPPHPYAWTKSLNWNMDPGKGSIENKNALDSAYKNLVEQDYD